MKRLAMLMVVGSMVLGGAGTAGAQGLDELSLGETWYGEHWDVADLKGRVVLMEIWGYN